MESEILRLRLGGCFLGVDVVGVVSFVVEGEGMLMVLKRCWRNEWTVCGSGGMALE